MIKKFKKIIRLIEIEDMKTNGRFTSALIAICCFFIIASAILYVLMFK